MKDLKQAIRQYKVAARRYRNGLYHTEEYSLIEIAKIEVANALLKGIGINPFPKPLRRKEN